MTREQKRADLVYKVVTNIKDKKKIKDDFSSIALRFPALLRSAGLVQALAFVAARDDEAHRTFLYKFSEILLKLNGTNKADGNAFDKLFEDAREAPLPQYMRLSREALAVSDWFKRFAQSILDAEHEGA